MKSLRGWMAGFAVILLLGAVLFTGCTRNFSIPSSPNFTARTATPTTTPTPTWTASFTSTWTLQWTFTRTSTPSWTPTHTPVFTDTPVPTDTFTETDTPVFTYTDTDTPLATYTFTNTPTPTPSRTPSPTPTRTSTPPPTPTRTNTPVDPNLIAHFEGGVAQNLPLLNQPVSAGYWYSVQDLAGSIVWPADGAEFTLSSPGYNGSTYAAQITGTTAGTGTIFVNLQANFNDPQAPYDIASNYPSATGVVFYIKGNANTTQVWFGIADSTTAVSFDNNGQTINVTTAWTPVTVFFNRMDTQGWGSPGHTLDLTTAVYAQWKISTPGIDFELWVDDFQFTNATAPPDYTPTVPPPANLIDDIEDNDNQIRVIQDSASHWRDGYWFGYNAVGFESDTQAIIYNAAGTIGNGVELSGIATSGNFPGLGFNFTAYDTVGSPNEGVSVYDGTVDGFTGISFYAKVNAFPSRLCHPIKCMPLKFDAKDMTTGGIETAHDTMIPLRDTWQQFTVYYNQMYSTGGNLVDATRLYQLQWKMHTQMWGPYEYDIVVDQVEFVSSPAPATTPGCVANMIDDMVDGDNRVITTSGDYYAGTMTGRNGYWYTYKDSVSTLCPPDPFFMDAPGYDNAMDFAAHITGLVAPAGPPYPYAGFGFDFHNDKSVYDCSAYTGIRFKAKRDSDCANGIRVQIPTTGTAGTGTGGTCPANCEDHFMEVLGAGGFPVLTTSWQTYTLPFSGFAQEGWGYIPPAGFDLTTVIALHMQLDNAFANQQIGFWLDEVEFY